MKIVIHSQEEAVALATALIGYTEKGFGSTGK